ncbi:MAG: hypothetical protein AAFO01_20000, partial [Pseudomonadota bacterium]
AGGGAIDPLASDGDGLPPIAQSVSVTGLQSGHDVRVIDRAKLTLYMSEISPASRSRFLARR